MAEKDVASVNAVATGTITPKIRKRKTNKASKTNKINSPVRRNNRNQTGTITRKTAVKRKTKTATINKVKAIKTTKIEAERISRTTTARIPICIRLTAVCT